MSTNGLHVNCPVGRSLPANYFSPGYSIMHGLPAFSRWAIGFGGGQSFRFERSGLGLPWVRVKEWTYMPAKTRDHSLGYRYRGKRLSGWPDEVEANDPTLGWQPCPNVNIHIRAASHATNTKAEALPWAAATALPPALPTSSTPAPNTASAGNGGSCRWDSGIHGMN